MKAVPKIFGWLDGVKSDRRIRANSCFKVAYQLAQRTNSAEFRKSGRLTTWQAIPTLSTAMGLSERMVRYAVRELEITGHLSVKAGHGPRQSNRYTLIEQKRQPVAAYNSGKSGNPLPHSGEQKRQSSVPKAATHCAESGNPLPPNLSIKDLSNLCPPNREREPADRGPRRALRALGPLAELEPDLRQRLGNRFDLLNMARVLPTDAADTIRLSVLTPYQRDQIKQKCEADILAVAGASKLEFVVEIAADPPKARRRP